MSSSKIVKWAVAALLAVPAIPLSARTISSNHKTLARHTARLTAASHRAHRYHHRGRHHVALATHHKHSHRLGTSVRRSTAASLSARPTVKITKLPPMIDGIGA